MATSTAMPAIAGTGLAIFLILYHLSDNQNYDYSQRYQYDNCAHLFLRFTTPVQFFPARLSTSDIH